MLQYRLWSTPRCDSSALINPSNIGLTGRPAVMKTSTTLVLCTVCVHWWSLGKHPGSNGDRRVTVFTAASGEKRTEKPIVTWEDLRYPDNDVAALQWQQCEISQCCGRHQDWMSTPPTRDATVKSCMSF